MLTDEQGDNIKKQLLENLRHFPEDKQEEVKQKVLSMSPEELEAFLIQNKLIPQEPHHEANANQCIFCSITDGKIPSHKIDENKDNLAILEINPLSKGHALIVPKKHIETEKIPSSTFTLAKKLAKKIKSILKPKEVKISSQNMFGHSIVEVLPLYGNETERKKASEKDLKELQNELKAKPRRKTIKKIKSKEQKVKKLPKITRIP